MLSLRDVVDFYSTSDEAERALMALWGVRREDLNRPVSRRPVAHPMPARRPGPRPEALKS